jgi:hypothetical protein
MRRKVLTKECPSCNDLSIDDDSNFRCNWGNSKIPKILSSRKRKKAISCKLIGKEKKECLT